MASLDTVPEVVKPKGKTGSRKAPAKKVLLDEDEDEDDEEVASLRDRLKAYKLDSSPEQSAGKLSLLFMSLEKEG